jgi:two-component system, cell cycle response regulator DivK
MTHRVLVVEDNRPNRELLCDWLESEGFEVMGAEDLAQSYAALNEKEPPTLVLLDVQLGHEDGLTLVAWIRKQERLRHIPVIAVTAHAMVTDQQRIVDAGCNACLAKPLDFKALRKGLAEWLHAPAT